MKLGVKIFHGVSFNDKSSAEKVICSNVRILTRQQLQACLARTPLTLTTLKRTVGLVNTAVFHMRDFDHDWFVSWACIAEPIEFKRHCLVLKRQQIRRSSVFSWSTMTSSPSLHIFTSVSHKQVDQVTHQEVSVILVRASSPPQFPSV